MSTFRQLVQVASGSAAVIALITVVGAGWKF
jgi:hypothetical protein